MRKFNEFEKELIEMYLAFDDDLKEKVREMQPYFEKKLGRKLKEWEAFFIAFNNGVDLVLSKRTDG